MKIQSILLCLSFIFGNILGAYSKMTVSTVIFIFLVVLSLCLSIFILESKYKKQIKWFVLCGLLIVFGFLRFVFAETLFSQSALHTFDQKEVKVIGEVKKDSLVKNSITKTLFEVKAVSFNEDIVDMRQSETVLLYTEPLSLFRAGDILTVKGDLQRIENSDDSFDFVYYMKKDGVLFHIFYPEIKILESSLNEKFLQKIRGIKVFFENRLNYYVPKPHSSLLSGMIISGKGVLPESIVEDFTKTGFVHVVVLSGFNIAIISSFFLAVCLYLRRSLLLSFFVVCFALALFVLIAGGSPPVLRAVLMGSLVLVGKVFAKSIDPNKVLFFVASILACINPYSVPFDPSFQLSFLATFGVINFTDMFKFKLTYIRFNLFKEIISSTLGALIMVSPFILYTIGTFSVVAIVVNVLLLPLVPILMLLGFLVVVFSFFEPLAYFLGFFATILSSVMFKVVSLFASLPFASITIKNVPASLILLFYGLILFWLYKNKKSIKVTSLDKTNPY